jgi:hypothetical protein
VLAEYKGSLTHRILSNINPVNILPIPVYLRVRFLVFDALATRILNIKLQKLSYLSNV